MTIYFRFEVVNHLATMQQRIFFFESQKIWDQFHEAEMGKNLGRGQTKQKDLRRLLMKFTFDDSYRICPFCTSINVKDGLSDRDL